MRKSTSIFKAVLIALFAVSLGVEMVSAAGFPSVKDLYGRYTFKGELQSTLGDGLVIPDSGYDMVVLPGATENEVKILGFFGFGNGIIAKYDADAGTLTCTQEAAYLSANLDMMSMAGAMVTLDGGEDGSLGYVYKVSNKDGIVFTAEKPMEASYMSYEGGGVMGTLGYAAGYTLTKQTKSVPTSSATGDYAFTGTSVVSTMLSDASEVFDLSVKSSGEGKVLLSGLFGFADEIEADYYEDGGLIVLPSKVAFANACFMASYGSDPEGLYSDLMLVEEAPYFYVENSKLITPCSFYVYGEFDEDFGIRNTFSFTGGEAVKDGGDIVKSVADGQAGQAVVYGGEGYIRVDNAGDAGIQVYDMQGMVVDTSEEVSVEFNGLKAGLYIVKVGHSTAKVLVK